MEISLEPLIVNPHFDEHERVVVLHDSAKGLKGIICIHSTALGPAMGGCRSASYDSPDAALSDALRLSQGMSYENALAGGGDRSPWAALGVIVALQACLGRPLSGARIAVQGLGAVGYKLCELDVQL
jgi:glutamate dehydrogenase/leucine dehydrogenase